MDCNEISCLTLKTKEIALEIEGTNLWIDFAKILKCKDDVYINATPIAQKFKKDYDKKVKKEERVRNFNIKNYLNLESTQRYIDELEEIFIVKTDSICQLSGQIELKKQPKTILAKHGFIYRKTGRYGGTWLHKRLFLNFARWLSPHFEIMCDQILEQVILQADELKEGRDVLRKLQRPLNDAIKLKIVDTGIKTDSVYMQFAVMIKRLIGCPDERDAYTKTQLDAAKLIIEEYRAMIIHGGKTSLKAMNDYLKETPLNLAWKKEEG